MKVGIIMGSTSDLPIMQDAIDVLATLGVDTEVDIVSAHRTPDKLFDYGKNAHSRGINCNYCRGRWVLHIYQEWLPHFSPLPVIGAYQSNHVIP